MLRYWTKIKLAVRKSIPLRTFLFYKKSIIFIVRLSHETHYERTLEYTHFYERFGRNREESLQE